MAQKNPQTGIPAIDECRLLAVTALVAPSLAVGGNDDVPIMTSLHGMCHGDGVYYSTVEHGLAVDHYYLAHIWQARRGTGNSQQTMMVAIALREVVCTSSQTVSGNHLKLVSLGAIAEVLVINRS